MTTVPEFVPAYSASRTAARVTCTSSAEVRQFTTLTRIAYFSLHVVPLKNTLPEAFTAVNTAAVRLLCASESPSEAAAASRKRTSPWFSVGIHSTSAPGKAPMPATRSQLY